MGQARNWTQEELKQLAEEWGTYSIPTLAKRLNRSENGIIIMAQRLNLGAHLESGTMISYNAFLKALGWAESYTEKRKKLMAAGMKFHKQRVRNCSFYMVDINEFWEFAEKNKHLFDFSNFEVNALGKEPEWAKVKRTADWKQSQRVKPHNTKWTESEDKELVRLVKAFRYTFSEIATRLHRTEGAIQRRLTDLGVKERPIKADNHVRWTDEELQTVGRMIKDGETYESMSQAVGKSAKAIRGRVYNMYLTENLSKVSKMIGDGEWGDNRPERVLSQRLLMTIEEKQETKAAVGQLAGLFTYRLRKHFDDQDNWQRNLCMNWDKIKGCTVGGTNCDDCTEFRRIRPQYCVRCGATFYERQENLRCERCRTERKKSAARKFMRLNKTESSTRDG